MPKFSLRKLSFLFPIFLTAGLAGCGGGVSSVVTAPLLSVSGTVATAMVGSAYSATIGITGGTAPYSCTVTASTLPSTFSVSSSCVISSAAPTVTGSYTVTVSVKDVGNPQGSGSGTVTVVVAPPTLVITSSTLPTGTVNIPYSTTIGVTGGTGTITCKVITGSTPPGLTLGSNCVLASTPLPTTAGSTGFTVQATDSGVPAQIATGNINITISAAAAVAGARVLAGALPVIGASVQFYAAGTTGNGSAPKALLTAPLTTDATGAFVINTANFTCPTSSSILYIVASGGKASAAGATLAGTRLMTSVGACSNLKNNSNLVINEVTTVASAYAFAQFLGAGAQMGASATNLSGITLAAGTLANLVDVTAGSSPGPGFPGTGTAPTAKLNLLADLVNACLTSSTGSACTMLYNDATVGTGTAPSNTLDAVLNLVKNPSLNVGPLYALAVSQTSPAYLPIPGTAPADWTLFINYMGGGMNDPTAVSIDSTGAVWVANYFSVVSKFSNTGVPQSASGYTGNSLLDSYGGAVDASNNFWVANEEGGGGVGSVSIFSQAGVGTGATASGGLNFPIAISFDSTGTGWVVDYGNSHLTLLNSDLSPYAPAGGSGYTSSQFIFPVAIAVDSNKIGWMANQSTNTVTAISKDGQTVTSYACCNGASGVAIDSANNVWVANYYGDSIGLVSNTGPKGATGTIVSGANGYVGGGVVHPQGIAVDGAGTVWVANYRGPSLSELSGAATTVPGTPISPAAGWAPDANLLEAFAVAIDASGNLWVSNFGDNILTEFVGMAVPVKTPLIGYAVAP